MFEALKQSGESKLVSFNGESYPRADMQTSISNRLNQVKYVETDLKNKEAKLKVLTETRDLRVRQRRELKTARDEMRLELDRIAKSLLEERMEQERTRVASDDGGLPPVRQDLKALRDRVRLLA